MEKYLKSGNAGVIAENTIKNAFPELKESKDEGSKKWILEYLYDGMRMSDEQFKDQFKSAISWLEKQDPKKQEEALEKAYKTADAVQYQRGYEDAKRELEKQGEQKSVPKFKAGDWVVHNSDSCICQIKSIRKDDYCLWPLDSYIEGYLKITDIDNKYHLWTIEDAKEGDVVVDKSDGTIGIFECIGYHPDGGSYNDPSYCFLHCRYDDGFFYADFENGNTIDSDDLIPATKKQRDTLMKAMADAGYTFDFESKELKQTHVGMPELKESEHEKVRKALIKYFNDMGDWNDVYGYQVVSWLEKQGEKPQAKSAVEAANEEKVDNTNKAESKV